MGARTSPNDLSMKSWRSWRQVENFATRAQLFLKTYALAMEIMERCFPPQFFVLGALRFLILEPWIVCSRLRKSKKNKLIFANGTWLFFWQYSQIFCWYPHVLFIEPLQHGNFFKTYLSQIHFSEVFTRYFAYIPLCFFFQRCEFLLNCSAKYMFYLILTAAANKRDGVLFSWPRGHRCLHWTNQWLVKKSSQA